MKNGYKKQAVTILSCLVVSLKGREYSVSGNLRGIRDKQHGFRSVLLYLGVPLFHVVREGVEQDFREYPLRAAPFQAAEVAVLLAHTEGAFGLDRAVESQQDALLAGDALPGRFPVLFKRPGDFDLPGLLRLRALLLMRTSGAALRPVRLQYFRSFSSII